MLEFRHDSRLIIRALASSQVTVLGATAEWLCEAHPDAIDDLNKKRMELNEAWDNLLGCTKDRKENLNEAQKFYLFLSKAR